MTDRERFIQKAIEHRVSPYKTKTHDKRCYVCGNWVHWNMQDVQPCIGAKPVYSMLHKFY